MERRLVIETGIAGEVARRIESALESAGFRLVRVRAGGGDGGAMQIVIERPDGNVGVDECARASRTAATILSAEMPSLGRMSLEVSSPGVNRPLARAEDVERALGRRAEIEMRRADSSGRRSWRGVILGFDRESGEAILEVSDGADGFCEARLALSEASSARLLSDVPSRSSGLVGSGSGRC